MTMNPSGSSGRDANARSGVDPTGPASAPHASSPVRIVRRLETAARLDRYDAPLRAVAGALTSRAKIRDALYGTWLGHAVHPPLTDVPVGLWTSATVLDVTGGPDSRRAAQMLVGAGLITALPTAVTGLAEWGRLSGEQRRVGLVHAVSNITALGLYSASFAARGRSRHRLGIALGFGGAAATGVSGFLGGHMTVARKVGSHHPAFETSHDPAEPGQ